MTRQLRRAFELSRQLHNLQYSDTGCKMASVQEELGRHTSHVRQRARWIQRLESVKTDVQLDEALSYDLKERLRLSIDELISRVRSHRDAD